MKLPLVRSSLLPSFLASLALLTGCYGSDFTATSANYTPVATNVDQVKVSSEHPDPAQYKEVGLLTGTGASFEGALKRLKESAAANGCDVVYILGEAIQSGAGTPGAAYGMSKSHLRAACFKQTDEARAQANTTPVAPVAPLAPYVASSRSTCAPDCRQGFDCLDGKCVSACNPACGDGETCGGHGANATCSKATAAGAAATN